MQMRLIFMQGFRKRKDAPRSEEQGAPKQTAEKASVGGFAQILGVGQVHDPIRLVGGALEVGVSGESRRRGCPITGLFHVEADL